MALSGHEFGELLPGPGDLPFLFLIPSPCHFRLAEVRGWDAFLVPESGDYLAAPSHDEITCGLGRTAEIHKSFLFRIPNRATGMAETENVPFF